MSVIGFIGSFPFVSWEEVKNFVINDQDRVIPTLPELTKVDGFMHRWVQYPRGLVSLENFKSYNYEDALMGCVGPLTLMTNRGLDEDQAVQEIISCIGILTDGLSSDRIHFRLDEPALHGLAVEIAYEYLWEVIFAEFSHLNLVSWMHTCADKSADWDRILKSNIDVVSIDASKNNILLYREAYKERRDRGGKIAWGINSINDIQDFQPGDFLTPTCGMANYTPKECYATLEMLKEAAEHFE